MSTHRTRTRKNNHLIAQLIATQNMMQTSRNNKFFVKISEGYMNLFATFCTLYAL